MDCLSLIQQAQAAGLVVRVDAGQLVIRGPKKLALFAKQLVEHKQEVIDPLLPPVVDPVAYDPHEFDADYEANERAAIQEVERAADERIVQQAAQQAQDDAQLSRFDAWQEVIDDDGGTVFTSPNYDADIELIDAAVLPACDKCGSLALWQSVVGRWRCCRCDPPTKAAQLKTLVEKIQRRHPQVRTTTADEIDAPDCPRNDAKE